MPSTTVTASIMPGESISTAVDCSTATPVRIRMPLGWQGAGSDVITFQTSGDNITYFDLFQANGKEVSATVVTGTVVAVLADMGLRSGQFLKIRAGRRDGPPDIQSAQRDFIIMLE
jgi:hypothetical protein